MERDGLADRDRSTRRRTVEPAEPESEDDYDPDQPIEERRGLRQDYRHLAKDFSERRSEMLIPGNHGLRDTMLRANQLTSRVKQTADATIDARLLVSTADLSYKKTLALTSGESAQGVDLEVFISKVRAYMRAALEDENAAPSNTQRQRGGEEEEEDDDMLNWAYLGRHACIPNIARPAVPGFLLGPLSLEKRAKRVVVRKERLRINDLSESRPEVVLAGDISNFLIRDGNIGVTLDERGLPYINIIKNQVEDEREQRDSGAMRHQAVLSLDMAMWKEMIEIFEIKEPMIPHRKEEEHSSVGRTGWYA
ncbi:putative Non-structural maintenance of chromosome element 4 [Glarea lozoyensis 74030]|uniref:Non-structural maintenance of chromosomes element 4 n=1 Tax=Glarea lozoyensis (strain ATCC 74030 / MF5533) TaxID=1104152 RepID=H0EMV4_GLAL7|nr:putative Non-structural maintenance of chromosome element 4 [Glarea lozoyensis 74030]